MMRLWSLHPQYLDPQGLVALWREALLAQNVLRNKTRGYKNHPQLERFKKHSHPQQAIAAYLQSVWDESRRRGYEFNSRKIGRKKAALKISVTKGQVQYEFRWLCRKLRKRSLKQYHLIVSTKNPKPHPFFKQTKGATEAWERIKIP